MITEVKFRILDYAQEFKLFFCFYVLVVRTDCICDIVFVFTLTNVHSAILLRFPAGRLESYQLVALRVVSLSSKVTLD